MFVQRVALLGCTLTQSVSDLLFGAFRYLDVSDNHLTMLPSSAVAVLGQLTGLKASSNTPHLPPWLKQHAPPHLLEGCDEVDEQEEELEGNAHTPSSTTSHLPHKMTTRAMRRRYALRA